MFHVITPYSFHDGGATLLRNQQLAVDGMFSKIINQANISLTDPRKKAPARTLLDGLFRGDTTLLYLDECGQIKSKGIP